MITLILKLNMERKNSMKRKNYNKSKGKKQLSSINLLDKRIIYIDGEITDEVAKNVIDKLLRLDMVEKKDITLYINSSGGSVSAGFAIFDVMNMIKSDVSTICVGKCASMAGLLLINGKRGKRYALPNSEVMVHEVSGFTMGKVTEMEDKVVHSKTINNKLWKIIASKTNMTVSQIKKEATRRDSWLSAKKALKYGFVDYIL